jgi:hypothetical protein
MWSWFRQLTSRFDFPPIVIVETIGGGDGRGHEVIQMYWNTSPEAAIPGIPAQPKSHKLPQSAEGHLMHLTVSDWLPPRDSNPDMLIQSQLSYH